MPYYRLEAPWHPGDYDDFFTSPLEYTKFRGVDQIGGHNLEHYLRPDQTACGLWLLQERADVLKFWNNEPAGEIEEKSRGAWKRLFPVTGSLVAGRLLIRISDGAFVDNLFFPDQPLLHLYSSSIFHMQAYPGNRNDLIAPGIRTIRVPEVNIRDEFIHVYVNRNWYPKSPELGRCIKELVGQNHNIDLLIPDSRCFDREIGNLQEDFPNLILGHHPDEPLHVIEPHVPARNPLRNAANYLMGVVRALLQSIQNHR